MRVIGKSLYGSQNLNLDVPDSDKDYKIIVMPEFYDLYCGAKLNKIELPVGYDREHNFLLDFRQFDSLLRRGVFNMIELLYSIENFIYEQPLLNYFTLARKYFKKQYAAYIWDNLFSSVKGATLQALKRSNYDVKSVVRGVYWINFLSQLIHNNFVLEQSLWDEVSDYPRRIRIGEAEANLKDESEWLDMFTYVSILAANKLDELKGTYEARCSQYSHELFLCARNYVAAEIRKELIEYYD